MPTDLPRSGPLNVALLGLGTVGAQVARQLLDPLSHVASSGRLRLVAVGIRDPDRARGVDLPPEVERTADLLALIERDDVDVVVELIGGLDLAGSLVERALRRGRSVVTANKALLARRGAELEALARESGASLRFEASVGGGIPILGPLARDLAADRIRSIRGIVNGTTNYILSAMADAGRDYGAVLADAQAKGYAEADPAGDVEGRDAADKLAILVRLAFGMWPEVTSIRRAVPAVQGDAPPGITGVQAEELVGAAELGLVLKLLAEASRSDANGSPPNASVVTSAVPHGSPLGRTGGVTNIIALDAEPLGSVSFRGPGAGGPASGSAVLGDLLAIANGEGSTWGALPPAPPASGPMGDGMAGRRRWFLWTDQLGGDLPVRVLNLVEERSGRALLTRPVSLDGLRRVLDDAGVSSALYPVVEDA